MKFLYFVICLFFIFSCQIKNKTDNSEDKYLSNKIKQTNTKNDSIKGAILYLKKNHYNFGKIRKKETPEINIDVKLENKGIKPLVIVKADVSCGCLSVDYPKNPILPGNEELIRIKINSTAQDGFFNKTVILKSNSAEEYSLIRVRGEIE